jgi:HEAT repeat protein
MEVIGKIRWNGQEVIPILDAASHDPNQAVRLAAIRAWGRVGVQDKKASVSGLLRILIATSEQAEGKVALEALEGLGPLTAAEVPTLESALREKSPAIRLFAINALGRIGAAARSAVPQLREALQDSDKLVRQAAIQALSNIGPAALAARPDLIEALKNREVRALAAEAILKLGPDASLAPMWIEMFKDRDDDVASTAVKAVAQLGKLRKEQVASLIDALKSNRPAVRDCAASALGEIGPDAGLAVTELLKAMQDPDGNVQKSAVMALGKIGPNARIAAPQLIAALKDKRVHDNAVEALGKLGKGAVPYLVQGLKGDELKHPQKLDILGILRQIGPDAKEAVPTLVAITKSFDELPSMRKAARAALDRIEAK